MPTAAGRPVAKQHHVGVNEEASNDVVKTICFVIVHYAKCHTSMITPLGGPQLNPYRDRFKHLGLSRPEQSARLALCEDGRGQRDDEGSCDDTTEITPDEGFDCIKQTSSV